jgi:hypothetical protein
MTLAVIRHRTGGWAVVDGDETISRHCTEWYAELVARGHALRRSGPRVGSLAAAGPALEPAPRKSAHRKPDQAATLAGALVLTTLLWGLIIGVVLLALQLLD